ncbi:MAG: hypothetical protein A2V90_09795 [Gammaproteobacteria bacterium RBG_16_57_12]|nr:MAG: hypothetical protein A2V90_09795 [Gammaproteobacteria bacterium RBG_16_57_12]
MFIGHYGIALLAKSAAPKASLGSLFLAAQFVDLLCPILIMLGIEQVVIDPHSPLAIKINFVHYPVSHSLLMVLGWGMLIGIAYYMLQRYPRGAIVMGMLVISHWLLDLLVHPADLQLYPGSTQYFGLGLWSSTAWSLLLEFIIFGLGCLVYLRMTRPRDATGTRAFWGLVVFLAVIFLGNIYGPPPPSVAAVAWVGQAQWLLIFWGYWIDRHREIPGP